MTGNARWDWGKGLAFLLAHWVFSLVVQVESYAFDVAASETTKEIATFVASLPLLQIEHVGVAAIPALLAVVCVRRGWRWLPILVLMLLNLWLVGNQVVYGLFFDHANLSMVDVVGREVPNMIGAMADSAQDQIDTLFAVNLLLAIGSCIFAARASLAVPRGWLVRPVPVSIALAAMLAGSAFASSRLENNNLEHHPVLALLRSAVPRVPAPLADWVDEASLWNLTYGAEAGDPSIDEALTRSIARLQGEQGPRNVLLLMLESVGAKQFLPNDRPSADRTPVLTSLLEHGVIFDSVYTVFPGTVRSLVSLLTGGRHLTWGSVHTELSHPYQSTTLVSALRDRGYATALYSAGEMNFESMDSFMDTLGFTHVFDPAKQSEKWREAQRVSSWGVEEDALRKNAVAWMGRQARHERPFFLMFVTLSTHHPYSVPKGFVGPFTGDGPEARYLNSLHYTDAFVGRLLGDLKEKGLLEELLIVVLGDHGQAFGKLHAKNFTHKNYLYDENVRSFLALTSPGSEGQAVISRRVGTLGDVMPTLLQALDLPPAQDVAGQSLWPGEYSPRSVYFHKNTHPEMWGTRDGSWKFIARKSGDPQHELYNLAVDPDEQVNLAADHPERLETYQQRCAAWFATMNHAFVSRLDGRVPERGGELTAGEVRSFGPKRVAFGHRDAAGNFAPYERLDSGRRPVVRTKWVAYRSARTIHFDWISPTRAVETTAFDVDSGWSTTWIDYPGPLPLDMGEWRIVLRTDDEELLSDTFAVE